MYEYVCENRRGGGGGVVREEDIVCGCVHVCVCRCM